MTKMEIATYIGLANIMLQTAEDMDDTDGQDLIQRIREALCQAQFILTQEAIAEFTKFTSSMDTEEQ